MELPQLHTEHRNHPTEHPSHHTGPQNRPTEHLLHPMAPQSLRMKRLVQIMVHQVQITEHLAQTTEPQPQFTLLHPPSTEARLMELPLPQLSRLPMLGDYHPHDPNTFFPANTSQLRTSLEIYSHPDISGINGRRISRRLSTQTVDRTCLAQRGKEDLMNATVSLWLRFVFILKFPSMFLFLSVLHAVSVQQHCRRCLQGLLCPYQPKVTKS